MNRTFVKFATALALTTSLAGGAALAQDYPSKEIQGIIQWGPAARPIPSCAP